MTTAQALESVLNAWVNGRKVRDGIPLTIRQQAEQALLTADAQATVEALQRERDEARRRVDELEAREVAVVLLRDELDAVREKAARLEAAYEKILLSRERLERELRGYPPVDNEGIPMVWQDPVGWVQRALNATTPAECTNHFTDGSKIFPSRNCCSKGAK